jgi:hypothetical protein
MKTRITFLFAVMAITNSLFSQIPNGGFENWTDFGNYSTPDNWGNLNPVTTSSGIYTCVKASPGYPGTTHMRLISRTVPGMGIQPGIAVSGVLNTSTFQAVSGFAYSSRPASLDGNWQFMAFGSDQGYIAVYLTKWNSGLNRRDTIGQVVHPLPGMEMSWRSFSLPLSYLNSDIPDSAMIILSASGNSPVNASYLYIDNLSFEGGTAGNEDPAATSGLTVFPNPVMQDKLIVNFDNPNTTADCIDILDIHGNLMIRKTMINQTFPAFVDVSTLRAGEYLLRITLPGSTTGSKFIKQ